MAEAPSSEEFVGRLFEREHLPLLPANPEEAARSFNQKFWWNIRRNLAVGFIWMALTGFAANRYVPMRAWIESSPMFAPDLNIYLTLYFMALVASLGGFYALCYNATEYEDGIWEREATAPASMVVGGLIGALVGFGPSKLVEYAVIATDFLKS